MKREDTFEVRISALTVGDTIVIIHRAVAKYHCSFKYFAIHALFSLQTFCTLKIIVWTVVSFHMILTHVLSRRKSSELDYLRPLLDILSEKA